MTDSRKIRFVYAPGQEETGSTVMRGAQLSAMVAAHFPDRDVAYTSDLDIAGSIVFVAKGLVVQKNPSALRRLKEQGNLVLADFVDAPIAANQAELADVIICATREGFEEARADFPDQVVRHLTHHADPRIPLGTGQRPAKRAISACP